MNRRAAFCVVLASCGGAGPGGAAIPPQPAAPPPDAAPTPPPLVTGRTCPGAHFATFEDQIVEIFEIAANCTTRKVATIEIDGPIFDLAWPRRDQPLLLASAAPAQPTADYIVVIDQPLMDATTRPPPRRLEPAGAGEGEPDGFQFALLDDATGTFVERCEDWDSGDEEDSEEWSCTAHIYFAVGDPAGRQAQAVDPAPRDAFSPLFAGGTVTGTAVKLQPSGDHLICTVDGHRHVLEPWGTQYGNPVTPLSVIPLSASDYLLGVDGHGSRTSPSSSVSFERMHGCKEGPRIGGVVPGPARYWAEHTYQQGWRIHVGGDGPDVLDAAGQPALFTAGGLKWTQP